ncbi:hypothetical protein HAX54_035203 [Datura stramonium]|uniref:Pectinesterase inhibitor domain-containing protein n=1 Tax=Datura stramonium TaxID=4076 RepID=A0ABS8VG91_DATST|nr:hypothetical protein [Datura stramonium]
MYSSINVSILATFVLASLLFSLPRTVIAILELDSPKLLKNACNGYTKGLINATRTQIYIEEKLKGNIQEWRRALNQCHNLYDHIIGVYKGALIHVEKQKSYDVAGAEFSMAANNAEYCENWLHISGVIDDDISSGNNIIKYLSLSGYNVVNDLMITNWVTKRK